MKKILFHIDSMQRGGANRVMANLTQFFSEKGYETILVNDAPPKAGDLEYDVPQKTERVFLLNGMECFGMLRKNFVRIKALRELIKKEKPDVVLSFMGPPNVRLLLAAIFLPTVKIVSVRNDPYREYGSGIKKFLINLLFLAADGVVFQTQDAAAYFNRSIRKRARIIYNPVDPKFYACKWNPINKSIAVVGRLEPQKNPMNAITAFQKLSPVFSNYTLDFYGDGSLRSELETYVQSQGLENRVLFHGNCSQVEKVLETSSLYVLSSDYEGMPNALMEAMAVGIPAISTDCPCGGPRALFADRESGLLVPIDDHKALCSAMEKVLSDLSYLALLGKNASERACDFHPDCVFAQWEEYFRSFSADR